MNYYKYLIRKIGKVVSENDCEYILYPFGERGATVKSILNVFYGIKEKAIIDNVLCNKYESIEDLGYLSNIKADNCKVLITSDNVDVYEELREQLYAVVEREKCIELFEIPLQITTERQLPMTIEKMEKEGISIYHPKKTNSIFYLPFLPRDAIQRNILLTDDYFERGRLNHVFKVYGNGIIGKKVAEGGVVLDVGANIGNHTLFFCNEYNAEKVYCFEPVKETFAILEENIKLNHLEERVQLNSFALGSKKGKGFVNYYNLNDIGGTSLRQDERGDLDIKSLDSLEIDEQVVLIKIDVEGMEREVIRGGVGLIKKNRPYIMVESFEEVFPETQEILCGLGYEYERLGDADWLFYIGNEGHV